jgi:hypothetical protein
MNCPGGRPGGPGHTPGNWPGGGGGGKAAPWPVWGRLRHSLKFREDASTLFEGSVEPLFGAGNAQSMGREGKHSQRVNDLTVAGNSVPVEETLPAYLNEPL